MIEIAENAVRRHVGSMGLRFKDQILGECFFVTTSFDEHRRYGDVPGVYEALADSLNFYASRYEAHLAAYVFMPTHIHLLMAIDGLHLSDFMRDYKKFIAQEAFGRLGIRGKRVWQSRFDRVIIYSEKSFRQKLEYIHRNPVKSGIVDRAETWRWSSAKDYLTECSGSVRVWKDWLF